MRGRQLEYYEKRMTPYIERLILIEEFINKELSKKYGASIWIPIPDPNNDTILHIHSTKVKCEGIRMRELYARREEILKYDTLFAMIEEKIHEGVQFELKALDMRYEFKKKKLKELLTK